jgi:uncharacterized repeat protein (TIGR01451 family)
MKSSLLLALSLFSILLSQAQNNPDFYVAPNGVTCMCPNANFGDTGTLTINGQTNTYTKRSRAQLDALIAADQNDPQIAFTCTSGITDMSSLFYGADTFNQPLNNWDVSNVQNMSEMFAYTSDFDQPLDNWDVSNVITMEKMFQNASSFNQPLNNWDVSNVIYMNVMFSECNNFNQPLNNWVTISVTDMSFMFFNASVFNQNINNWDVSSVTNMRQMFREATSFDSSLSNWNTSNVTDMSQMFSFALSFSSSISNWDTSNVINMLRMFEGTQNFNSNISNWNTSNVITMSSMFFKAHSFNQNLNSWDVSNVLYMNNMFKDAVSFNSPLNNWNISNVTNIGGMFYNAIAFNQPLDNWDVSNIDTFWSGLGVNEIFTYGVFEGASAFDQDISSWDFSSYELLDIISNSGISKENYDLLLEKLASYNISNGTLGAENIEYCDAFTRELLLNNGWNVNDGGQAAGCDLIYVSGKLKYDENSNGCDPNDLAITNYLINANNGTGDVTYNVDINGEYVIDLISGTYTLSILNLDSILTSTPSSHTINFTGQDEILENIDFCITANQQFEDLSVDIFPLEDAIPGFETDYQIIVSNNGTQTVPNVQVMFGYDESFQTYVSSTVQTSGTATDVLDFQFTNLEPFSQEVFEITLLNVVPPTLNSGDVLTLTVQVTPDTNDTNIKDNLVIHDQTVVNSFDPNDKMVVQGDEIEIDDTDQYLDYRIRFQNLGTANALNVKITDTIDNNLDWTTFQPITSSHDYRIEIIDGEQINYYFDNINLPFETADPEGSNGYITYKIKPKPTVQIGDTFENTAYIYFDFNLPIVTNTVTTTVVDNLDAESFDFNRIKIYPNPVSDQLNIELPNNLNLNAIELFDIQGKLIKNFKNKSELNLSQVQKGIYILKLETDQGSFHHKIIKE